MYETMTVPGENADVDAFNLLNAVLRNNWLAASAVSQHGDYEQMLATMTAWLSIVLLGLAPEDRDHILGHFRSIITEGDDAKVIAL
jgi:hypothetical protein